MTRASGADTSPAIIATRPAMSSKSTISSGACDSVSCTMAIEPTRRTASSSAPAGLRRREPPRLQPQQRGDGLQVVLDPVMDLPDRRVLGDQLALAVPQLGHVPEQDQRAGPAAVHHQRDGPQLDDRAVRLDLGLQVRPAAGGQHQRVVARLAGRAQPGRQRPELRARPGRR